MTKKNLLILFLIIPFFAFTQIPPRYYDEAVGKQHQELKESLFHIIKNSTSQEYSALWNFFILTDSKENGKVWDIYSDYPDSIPSYEYTFHTDQCGNYAQEGDCYNREHSVPKSWFGGDQYPMFSDLFHIYPTDGWVNGIRDNWPYGEVTHPTRTTQNGSKLGPCSYPGYTGKSFEPIDEYKGDLARTYFYMSIRYQDKNLSQASESQFNGSELAPWALAMMIEWHLADPVSEKEISRNNVIYTIQNNRNPFIDYPELVSYLWGEDTLTVFAPYIVSEITTFTPHIKQIFPNPAHDQVTIHFATPTSGKLILTDIVGKVLYVKELFDEELCEISTSHLQAGIYSLSYISNHKKETQKLIIW